jgi:hypothetical protein
MLSISYQKIYSNYRSPIPSADLPLFREWIARFLEDKPNRHEFANAIEEVFTEYRTGGVLAGRSLLALWARLLREQKIVEQAPNN